MCTIFYILVEPMTIYDYILLNQFYISYNEIMKLENFYGKTSFKTMW